MRRSVRTPVHSQGKGTNLRAKSFFAILLGLMALLLYLLNTQQISPVPEAASQNTSPQTTNYQALFDDFEKLCAKQFVPLNWFLNARQMAELPHQTDVVIVAKVPERFPLQRFLVSLQNLFSQYQLDLIEAYEELVPERVVLTFGSADGKRLQFQLRTDHQAEWHDVRVAVVIDDFGYKDDEVLEDCLNLPLPVAVAIISGTPFSETIARRAKEAGFEVLIHLPMEPQNSRVENNGYTIFTGMSEKEMAKVIRNAIESVPGAVGLNNHMGSKATTHRLTMRRFMNVLKSQQLFFLDSETSRRSVAYAEAVRAGIPALKMTTYLDNPESSRTVAEKLGQIIQNLQPGESAVVIGHARAETIRTLRQEMPRWAFLGVSFVQLKQILENH